MKITALFVFVGLLFGSVYCSCSASVSQNLRTSWTSNGVPFYLYDVTIINNGTLSYTAYPSFLLQSSDLTSRIAITDSWSLTLFANTPPFTNILASAFFGSQLGPGTTYQNAGYIIANTTTTLSDISFSCAATTSAPTSPPTSPPTSGPTSAPTTSAPTSAPCAVKVEQTLRTQWVTDSISFFLYDLTFTNTGSSDITLPDVLLLTSTPPINIVSTWNLITFANTPPYANILVALAAEYTIEPGQSFTGAGYITTTKTTLGETDC